MDGQRACPECGAVYATDADSCTARFDALLALDHSRHEPWGSRHGQAFAAFVLQHPVRFRPALDGAWAALCGIYLAGLSPAYVFATLMRQGGRIAGEWEMPERPGRPTRYPTVTIVDLGEFSADGYPELLDRWCRAALDAWCAGERR